jgi:hypothetical protein
MQSKTIDETARRVGFSEFLTDLRAVDDAHMAIERLINPAIHNRGAVVHEVAADLIARIGKAVGMVRIGREKQQARCANAVAAEHNDVGCAPMPDAGHAVDVGGACHASVASRFDFLDTSISNDCRTGGDRLGDHVQRHVVHGASRTAALAGAAIVARHPTVEPFAKNGDRHRPAMPAEPVECLSGLLTQLSVRRRTHLKRTARRNRRIASRPPTPIIASVAS